MRKILFFLVFLFANAAITNPIFGKDVDNVLEPDYIISTSFNSIIITDNAGNSDVLNVSENGSNIQFATDLDTRTYSIDGGVVTPFSTPANLPYAGRITVVIDAGAGDDFINIGAFTANFPVLTINGGTGNDVVNFNGSINFASNSNLNVDLQDDNANPGVDRVVLATNAVLTLQGTATATMKVSQDVVLNTGAGIVTINGNLTVEANQQASATSGNFVGIDINGGLLRVTGIGLLTVKGRGGNVGGTNAGIYLQNAGKIEGGSSGMVTVQGTGGR
jgi:hypothetical protein